MVLEIIVGTIAVILILEGLFISVYPKKTKRALSFLTKKEKKIRTFGIVEIVCGIILLLAAMWLRGI